MPDSDHDFLPIPDPKVKKTPELEKSQNLLKRKVNGLPNLDVRFMKKELEIFMFHYFYLGDG
jgi:hypothetical protein